MNKVRFTTVEGFFNNKPTSTKYRILLSDLREDVDKLMTERVEVMKVKLTNELLPS